MNELCPVCGAYFPCEHIEPWEDTPIEQVLESWSDPLTDADYADMIVADEDSRGA